MDVEFGHMENQMNGIHFQCLLCRGFHPQSPEICLESSKVYTFFFVIIS
jgi:hypothetical protein